MGSARENSISIEVFLLYHGSELTEIFNSEKDAMQAVYWLNHWEELLEKRRVKGFGLWFMSSIHPVRY